MIQKIIRFFLLVLILTYSKSLSSQEVSILARNPISIELSFVLPTENYLRSTLGEIDYLMILDFVKDPENMTTYPFKDYSNNFISDTKSSFGFELGGSLIPKLQDWHSSVIFPEINFGIGYYRNNFSHFGHFENTTLSNDTIQKESIYYLHYFDYIVASGDFVVHYKILKWLNVYAGLGIVTGISTRSKIDETIASYKYLESNDLGNRHDNLERNSTLQGKQLVKAGFSIPIGLHFAIYKQVALRLEYKWGQFYQFVINGDTYPKRMNNFAFCILYRI